MAKRAAWFVYILRCRDGSLYTGITLQLARRLEQHNAGKASRYTRVRLPVEIVYTERCNNRSQALRREYAMKQLSRQKKERLIPVGAIHELPPAPTRNPNPLNKKGSAK